MPRVDSDSDDGIGEEKEEKRRFWMNWGGGRDDWICVGPIAHIIVPNGHGEGIQLKRRIGRRIWG